MANFKVKKPPISQAVDEALEARCASNYAYQAQLAVQRAWDEALANGELDADEIQRLTNLQREASNLSAKAFRETEEVVPMIADACVFLTNGVNYALYGTVAKSAIEDAATVGIDVGVLTAAGD